MEWKIIDGYPLYKINNIGQVKSIWFNKEKIIKPIIGHGYYYVNLHNNNGTKRFAVHRLVANAFISNPYNKLYVDHIDGNKSNNAATNLRWVTAKENSNNPISLDRMRKNLVGHYAGLGRYGKKHPLAKPVDRIDIYGNIKSYECIEEAARDGFEKNSISKCCRKLLKSYKGYIWRFAGDDDRDLSILHKELAKRDWPVWRKDIDGTITYYEHVSDAIKQYGLSKKHIYQCCKSPYKRHYNGFVHWSFIPFSA
jgi:NUMOD4 motif./HNH endonuclease.